MHRTIILLGLIFMSSSMDGQTKNFIDQPFIETTAEVDTLVTPDRIYLSILISENDTKGKEAVEDLERRMAVKLEEVGINLDEQLTLTDLSSNFRKYFLRKQDILKAKSFELLVYDARSAGQVIYEMEGLGISNVDLDRTEYSKIEDLKLELKRRAIVKAKRQANAMVKSLDQSVGRAIFISDIPASNANVLQGRVAGVRIRGSSSRKRESVAIPIEFEKIKIESQVRVNFIIN